jgi:hypothetical protein
MDKDCSGQAAHAVAGQVERGVRPRAWACVWPDEAGCGGGGFTTLDERTALNYMAGATESADSGRSKCRPALVPLYDAQAVDAMLASELERIANEPPVSGDELAQARVLLAAAQLRGA